MSWLLMLANFVDESSHIVLQDLVQVKILVWHDWSTKYRK